MPAYHQMGHDSENLLKESHLSQFAGAILSPVNYDEKKVAAQIQLGKQQASSFDSIFDPQLYIPTSERGCLREWKYFPVDVDTADLQSESWWTPLNKKIVEICQTLQTSAVCSPAVLPKTYSDEYFAAMVKIGNQLCTAAKKANLRPLQTAIVGLPELAEAQRPLSIASILSRTAAQQIYLVLVGTTEPRREIADVDELKGAMLLIRALKNSGLSVLVGYCSSDLVLWKTAGAAHCATGKFFNLRRFTRTRFEEPGGGGGGQLPYWFEESLMAFLRESDLLYLQPLGLITLGTPPNRGSPIIGTKTYAKRRRF